MTRRRGTCLHCKRPDVGLRSRSLCHACYSKPAVRYTYPASKTKPAVPSAIPRGICRHCQRDVPIYARDLCSRCGHDKTIREQYPKKPRGKFVRKYDDSRETMADLEALIAERMKTLPRWWAKEVSNTVVPYRPGIRQYRSILHNGRRVGVE